MWIGSSVSCHPFPFKCWQFLFYCDLRGQGFAFEWRASISAFNSNWIIWIRGNMATIQKQMTSHWVIYELRPLFELTRGFIVTPDKPWRPSDVHLLYVPFKWICCKHDNLPNGRWNEFFWLLTCHQHFWRQHLVSVFACHLSKMCIG